MDVSLNPSRKDVRVLTFEDRHDCMHCLTMMQQWPPYASAQLSMGMMPTDRIEQELRDSYAMRRAMNASVSEPAGVVVMRRGKLSLRVGMGMEEFTQLVVYQAAAQLSLERIGYGFDE
jgi:hypothetical protein